MSSQALIELLGDFDSEWSSRCASMLEDGRRAAINTVTSNRNRIAHGEWVGATLASVSNDYHIIKQVVDRLPSVLAPPAA